MTAEPLALPRLDALDPNGSYRARNRAAVLDVSGRPVAELSLVPKLFVNRAVAALRAARPLPFAKRVAAIERAGALFAGDEVGAVAGYQHLVSRAGGLPISAVRTATATVARRLADVGQSIERARPAGAVLDWRDPLTVAGRAVWTRRGEVFAVHAAGNHPAVHSLWPEALALGYRVIVRPSHREPFTAHRLITALRLAGFGTDHVVLAPTDHDTAGELLRSADLGMVYGSEDVIRRYGDRGTILPQGPGRSKILITAEVDWRTRLDTIVESIIHDGGTGCVNATAVFVEGDPAPLAAALAERLAAIPSAPPQDERAVLPVTSVPVARALEKYLTAKAAGTRAWLGGIVDEFGDGSAALRPAVHQVDRPDAAQTGIELAFPCVWVAPWTEAAGIRPLRSTLALTALTTHEPLIDALLAEPTISNLYLGNHPTSWTAPSVPHDGYLADFLMRTKAVVRD